MSAIKITPLRHDTGNTTFLVSGTVLGEQRRQRVKSDIEATTLKQNWEREKLGAAPLPAITTRLTDAQAREAEVCFARLDGAGYSMTKAIDFALANYRPSEKRITVADAVKLFIADKRRHNLRDTSVATLEDGLRFLTAKHGAAQVSEILPEHLRELVFVPGLSPRTQINRRLLFSGFLNWAVEQGYAAVSPLAKVKAPKARGRKAVSVLSLSQCWKLMAAALAHNDGATVPYFAACLFGGLRPAETARLSWNLVNLKAAARIDIGPDVAKTGETRYVNITPNLREWLEPHALKKTAFAITRYDFDAVRKLAKLDGWPHDVMRHTCVSNYLAHFKDSGAAVERHGHSVQVMLKHYRERVTPEDAAHFWGMTPDGVGMVTVDLKAAAA